MNNEEHKGDMHHEKSEHQEEKLTHTTHNAKRSDSIRINKKTAIAVLFVVAVVALAYVGKGLIYAVTVDGSPITRLEVMRSLERTSGKQYAETLITEKLILNEARKKHVTVTEAEVASEIARIEASVTAQGATMDMLLSSQGLTRDMLHKQIVLKNTLEKLLSEKVAVSDEEVDAYIKQSKVEIPAEQMAEARTNITEQLKGQKLNAEAPAYIDALRTSARIVYYGDYIATVPATTPTAPQQ